MKKTWYVHLIAQPKINDYRSDYFPRKFFYKADAVELKEEVERKGGVARVSDEPTRPPPPPKLLHSVKSNPIPAPTPYLVFDRYGVSKWFEDLPAFREKLEAMKKACMEATGYVYANSHNFITDVYGRLLLLFQIYRDDNSLHLWDYKTGVCLPRGTAANIHNIINETEKGNLFCGECNK